MTTKRTVQFLALILSLTMVIIIDARNSAKAAEEAPRWLKECSYDAEGKAFSYTCDYVTEVDACAITNC